MSESPESDSRVGRSQSDIAQPTHGETHLAFLLATEQHHQIITGTQRSITARHDLTLATTQSDNQTA